MIYLYLLFAVSSNDVTVGSLRPKQVSGNVSEPYRVLGM
jgi:hypothetical protein